MSLTCPHCGAMVFGRVLIKERIIAALSHVDTLSARQLAIAVYGSDDAPQLNALRVHITQMRQQRPGSIQHVGEGRAGRGYRYVE